MTEPEYIPNAAAHEEGELPQRLSDTTLAVRYKGTSNLRSLSARDLSGDPNGNTLDQIIFTPESEIDWDTWERMAGSRERAMEVIQRHSHEFVLVGPGADDLAAPEVEEFSIGGVVAD